MAQDFSNLELMVEVEEDHVVLSLPDMPCIAIKDSYLDELFYYPEKLSEMCLDDSKFLFWHNLIPNIIRVRERKRDLYFDMANFCSEYENQIETNLG